MECTKINSCEKINIILDKDMLDFQYAECIRDVCALCKKKCISKNSEWMPDEYEIDGFVDGCQKLDRNYVLLRYGIHQQKRLLEYLIKSSHYAKLPVEIVTKTTLESMLGELEEGNE